MKRFFLALILTLTACVHGADKATVYGTILFPDGRPYQSYMLWDSKSTPVEFQSTVIGTSRIRVNLDANGYFTTNFFPGLYQVTLKGTNNFADSTLYIQIPSTNTYEVSTLVTNTFTPQIQYPPTNWLMVGATSLTNGRYGFVPTPTTSDRLKFLRGDGTWVTVSGGGVEFNTNQFVDDVTGTIRSGATLTNIQYNPFDKAKSGLIVEGDSLMANTGIFYALTNSFGWGGKFAAISNFSLGGSQIADLINRWETNSAPAVAAMNAAGITNIWLMFDVGANDLGGTSDAFLAAWSNYVYRAKSSNVTVVAFTVPPQTNTYSQATFNKINYGILMSQQPDYIVDFSGLFPNPYDANFYVDAAHFTSNGYKRVASAVDYVVKQYPKVTLTATPNIQYRNGFVIPDLTVIGSDTAVSNGYSLTVGSAPGASILSHGLIRADRADNLAFYAPNGGIYMAGEITNYLAGWLGIKTLSPTVPLDVEGSGRVRGYMQSDQASALAFYAPNGGVYANGIVSNYFAGSVGIKTLTPAYPLDVNGSARIQGFVQSDWATYLAFYAPNGGIYTGGDVSNYFAGKLGIGTLAPTEKLQVIGNASITGTNYVGELVITNGATINGSRITSWPTGGSGGASASNAIPFTAAYVDASNVWFNAGASTHFNVTLTNTVNVLNAPTNAATDGQRVTFRLIQDASGNRPVTMTGSWRFGTDITAITCTTNANKVDYMGAMWNSLSNCWDVISFVRGY